VLAVSDVRLLPEVIDFTLVTNLAGAFGLVFTMIGALLRYDPDRLARLTLLGTVGGGAVGAVLFVIALALEVL
jgi:membrane associated rhomboid family serine protease